MISGEESSCSKFYKCWELKEKVEGIYTERMVIFLSKVTETAVACSFVCNSILLCRNDDF